MKTQPTPISAEVRNALARESDPLNALMQFEVTKDHVMGMESTRLIWRNAIAWSHILAMAAPGNAGKTVIAKTAAGELSATGFRVFYFQEDAAAGELPEFFEHAKKHHYTLLNSTLTNSTPEHQIQVLRQLVKKGEDLSNAVMFFDTLKKYVDLMSKGGAREFFRLMRSLTQRGATIVLLGHTNKNRGSDGKLIFEGVGDIRNDVDELSYVESTERDAVGIVTITMTPDKQRSFVVPVSFTLDTSTMTLTPITGVVNVAALAQRQRQMKEDEALIAHVFALLGTGGMAKMALVTALMDRAAIGKRVATGLIERYMGTVIEQDGTLWIATYMRLNNVIHVSLPPEK